MTSSSLGDRKQVQDARLDNHLTGVEKESFYWLTKTIAHNKEFPRKRKKKKLRHVEKVYSVKSKSSVSFSSLMQRWSILEAGHCVCLEVAPIFPLLVLLKNEHCKRQRSFSR